VARLHGEVVKALRRADVQSELAGQGASPMIDAKPADMANYMKAEGQKWEKVINALGLKAH
jgi:tripartite-type tricarboxylate transporter receptor subunit TctC